MKILRYSGDFFVIRKKCNEILSSVSHIIKQHKKEITRRSMDKHKDQDNKDQQEKKALAIQENKENDYKETKKRYKNMRYNPLKFSQLVRVQEKIGERNHVLIEECPPPVSEKARDSHRTQPAKEYKSTKSTSGSIKISPLCVDDGHSNPNR